VLIHIAVANFLSRIASVINVGTVAARPQPKRNHNGPEIEALEAAVNYYDDHMQNALLSNIPVEQAQLDAWHKQFLDVSLKILREKQKFGDLSVLEKSLRVRSSLIFVINSLSPLSDV